MINYGDKTTTVLKLQKCLSKIGIDVGVIDGVFGPKTLKGWTEFVQEHLQNYKIVSDIEFSKLIEYAANIPTDIPTSVSIEEAFIRLVKPFAIEVMKKSGLPASVSIGQAILETNYGQSNLAKNALNYHGIKAGFGIEELLNNSDFPEWNGKIYKSQDDEPNISRFMVFNNIINSFWTHDRWFAYWEHYHEYFKYSNDAYKFLKCISQHYATSSTYFEDVLSIIQKHNLFTIDKEIEVIPSSLIIPWKELHLANKPVESSKTFSIAIMPGHGGEDPGAVNSKLALGKTYSEKDYNRFEAEEVKRLLEARGNYNVTICRTKDEPRVPLNHYQKRVNDLEPDLCLCIHHNANNGKARGWWLFYTKESDRRFAKIMADKYGVLPLRSRGFEYAGKPFSQDWFSRVNNCIGEVKAPTVLLESCFIDNNEDCEWLVNGGYKDIANSIVAGVISYLEE